MDEIESIFGDISFPGQAVEEIASTPETVQVQEWHTYDTWATLGRQVRRGQKGTRRNDNILFEIRQTCTRREVMGKAASKADELATERFFRYRNSNSESAL